ncbi:hypothetical protein ABTI86_19400, partial [Acinetobacter baumannii]
NDEGKASRTRGVGYSMEVTDAISITLEYDFVLYWILDHKNLSPKTELYRVGRHMKHTPYITDRHRGVYKTRSMSFIAGDAIYV